MADGVELDPGTGGAVVATDDAGAAGQVQIVKLAISTDGSATVIPADGTNGLAVDVKQIAAGDNNIGSVDVASSALPTGAATSAKQDTAQTALDAIKTSVQLLDDTVSGTELQVDVLTLPALPAGNNNIGDVDIASIAAGDNNIGNVDVASLPALPAGNNNIGDVDIASIAAGDNNIGNVDVVTLPALPAGTNNIGDVDVLTLPALPAGTNAIGKLAANSGVDIGDVDVTSISAGTNTIGNVGLIGRTSGGLSMFKSLDLDETEEDVKTSAGQLFGWYIFNAAASTRYVKLYNATAANVTVGTTTPVLTIPVPAGSAANVFSNIGIAFGTAISAAATTGVADNDTGAPSANDVVVNFFYA